MALRIESKIKAYIVKGGKISKEPTVDLKDILEVLVLISWDGQLDRENGLI